MGVTAIRAGDPRRVPLRPRGGGRQGQLYLLLSAARELARTGELSVNVRFVCDGEEETGGHSIVEYLEADKSHADAAVIFDMGMIRKGLPAFSIATRGIAYFHVTLRAASATCTQASTVAPR